MKNIKIKLDKSTHLTDYLVELERWEGEGGSSSDLHEILDDINLPLRPGEIYEVVDGRFIFDEGYYFYEAHLLPLPVNKDVD